MDFTALRGPVYIMVLLIIIVLIGLIVGAVKIFSKPYSNKKPIDKRCRYCAEILKLEETVCHHCGKESP
jgi:hypothetical protein